MRPSFAPVAHRAATLVPGCIASSVVVGCVVGLVVVAGLVAGCAGAGLEGTPLVGSGGNGGNGGTVDGATCDAPPRPPLGDPATLPDCSPACGGAHCVPAARLSPDVSSQLDACPGGYCVPDALIVSGAARPPACASLGGAAGVCLSVCVPRVGQFQQTLPQATCAAGERCAPCIDPLTNKPSGACDIGGPDVCAPADGGSAGDGGAPVCPHSGPPVLDPGAYPDCDSNGGAHCLPAMLVAPSLAAQLATCPGGRCVPDVFIAAGGNYIPPTCTSLAGAEGRCLHEAIPSVQAQAASLPVDVCQSYERCVPCYAPRDGKATGACSLSCDPGPARPPVLFASCCKLGAAQAPQGRCLPKMAIPASQQSQLGTDTCKQDAELCVPDENLDPNFQPARCTASSAVLGSYAGVCLSKCLSLGVIGLAVAAGNCDELHQCVPCTFFGLPSNAPGCS